ncbi:hypothetical protein GOBAR_DD04274 [Gossypium barbadense]|nr:hypothetical protein GOBAR_DD04274 [Gossypium barbadense]
MDSMEGPANSPGSTAARQRQQQEAGGKLIRSILSSNETGQNQSSTAVQAQQKTETMSLDNVKRPLRPTNSRLGLNGPVSNDIATFECDFDTKSVSNEKFIKKALHGSSSRSEKHENVQEIRIDLIMEYGPLFIVLMFQKLVRSS